MNKREKILAIAVAVLILGFGGTQLWQRYQDALSGRRNRVTAAREALHTTKLAEARGQMAMKNLELWQERSLPGNVQQARALYRDWLLERIDESGLTEGVLKYMPQQRRSTAYETVGYTIEAKGSAAAISAFLYEFYHSDHLHKIAYLRLRPEAESENLFVTMRVEGLSVQGAVRDDTLSDGVSDRLALEDSDAYRESLAGRNIFKTFSPPRNESGEAEAPADFAKDTRVTFITGEQVWLTNSANGRVLRLREGDRIRIPGFFGRVQEIRRHEVVVSVDNEDELLEVRAGKSLREGRRVKVEAEPAAEDTEANAQTGG